MATIGRVVTILRAIYFKGYLKGGYYWKGGYCLKGGYYWKGGYCLKGGYGLDGWVLLGR